MGDENSKGTHWVSLLIHKHLAAYFDFFGSEYISLEVLNKSDLNQLLTIYLEKKWIYYVWVLLYQFHMLAGKTLLDYTNMFSSNDYKKNDKIIYKYFKINMEEETSLEFRLRKSYKKILSFRWNKT